MKNPLNLITDENSIMITAEFLETGEILKIGECNVRRLEIDLIVKNDITIEKLLIGIKCGIQNKLLNKYHFDVEKDTTDFIYCDYRHPESETHDDEVTEKHSTQKKAFGFFKHRAVSRAKKNRANTEEAYEALSDHEKYDVIDDRTIEEKERDYYIVCWNVFNECYEYYKKYDVIDDEIELIKYGSNREPVIGISSIDYNKVKPGTKLSESDVFKICLSDVDNSVSLKELGFITTTRVIFDPIGWHKSAALFDPTRVTEAFKDQVPLYNISERPLRILDETTINIISPLSPPVKQKINPLTLLLSPLLMFGIVMIIRINGSSGYNMNESFLLMGGMSLIGLFTSIISIIERNRTFKADTRKWKIEYENYIRNLIDKIQKKQSNDIEILNRLYPPAFSGLEQDRHTIVTKSQHVSGDIFSRDSSHPDFLKIRIGISTEESKLVPSVFKIIGEKKEAIFSSSKYYNIRNITGYPFTILLANDDGKDESDGSGGYLINLPSDLSEEYSYLKKAPVLLSLYESRSVGIVFDDHSYFKPFLSNIILELCFYHSPDNLQCIAFFDDECDIVKQQEIIRRYKHLPHFRELMGDISSFAFNKEDAYLILNKLLEILSERKKSKNEIKVPHIIMIIMNDYELKRHPVSEYLPSFGEDPYKDNYGISFIFCKKYTEELPKYCDKIIKRETNSGEEGNWFLLPHIQQVSDYEKISEEQRDKVYSFYSDALLMDEYDMGNRQICSNYYRAFKSLSALYYERIAQGTDVPSRVELFDLLDVSISQKKN